jgi:hypothetical protein
MGRSKREKKFVADWHGREEKQFGSADVQTTSELLQL